MSNPRYDDPKNTCDTLVSELHLKDQPKVCYLGQYQRHLPKCKIASGEQAESCQEPRVQHHYNAEELEKLHSHRAEARNQSPEVRMDAQERAYTRDQEERL